MNERCPLVTLTADESARVRTLVRERGAKEASKALGNVDARTLLKAAAEAQVSRLTAEVIRGRLDRI